MEFSVITSSWSGWVEDYKPVEKEYNFTVEKGKTYNVGEVTYYENGKDVVRPLFTFKITKLLKNGFEFKTEMRLCSGYVNFMNTKNTFAVTTEQPCSLITPTTDCGEIFTLLIKQ